MVLGTYLQASTIFRNTTQLYHRLLITKYTYKIQLSTENVQQFGLQLKHSINKSQSSACHYKTLLKQNIYATEGFTRSFALGRKLPYEVDTNVVKDVLLYEYESARFFNLVIIFSVAQFIFWIYLAHFAYTCLIDITKNEALKLGRPAEPDTEKPWWRRVNLGEKKYRNGLTTLFASIGVIILVTGFGFSSRTIRTLHLLRGGTRVKIRTYSPLPFNRTFTTSLENLASGASRGDTRVIIPLKVRGHRLYYCIDKRGEFTNVRLFDYTVGMQREFKK